MANLRVCHALLLLGVVVGRLNKHTTPQKERVKKRNGLCNCKEHQIDFKEDACRVQKEEKGDKAFAVKMGTCKVY